MRYGLRLTTPPTDMPVSVDEAVLSLRIDSSIYDLALVQPMILAATQLCEAFTRRQFLTATYTLTLDAFPDVIRLPRPPLQSVTSVAYLDGSGVSQTLVQNTDYLVDTNSEPGRITRPYNAIWPVTYPQANAVTVTYVAGWPKVGDVPESIKAAIRLIVGDLYQQRESVTDGTIEEFPAAKALLMTQLVNWHEVATNSDSSIYSPWKTYWLT